MNEKNAVSCIEFGITWSININATAQGAKIKGSTKKCSFRLCSQHFTGQAIPPHSPAQ